MVIDFSGTTWGSMHSCPVLIGRVDAPKNEPLACSGTEGTFIVSAICHTQRGWLVSSRYSHDIIVTWSTPITQQGWHHTFIQSWKHPQNLLLWPLILWALPIWQPVHNLAIDISTKRIESTRFGPFGCLSPNATSISWPVPPTSSALLTTWLKRWWHT